MKTIEELIRLRSSCRAFLPQAVDRTQVTAILNAARWSPSGVNMQPWQVAVVTGDALDRLSAAMVAASEAGQRPNPDYDYYPQEWFEPYKERRRATGIGLYQALGIGRDDEGARREAWHNNYRFFGAPVGLLLFVDRRLGQGSWVDMGIFMQSLMLAATEQGLATCPQASLADYPDIVRSQLQIDSNLALLGGIALGHADPDAAANRFHPQRETVESFTRWYD